MVAVPADAASRPLSACRSVTLHDARQLLGTSAVRSSKVHPSCLYVVPKSKSALVVQAIPGPKPSGRPGKKTTVDGVTAWWIPASSPLPDGTRAQSAGVLASYRKGTQFNITVQ